ncbi:transposase for ISEc12 [Escherichia coli]|nr:transposase for ISEc12 [Escherichia coli]
MPDMLYFDTEMRKPGVTRQLLWMEYKAQAGDKAMGYSHFCRCYREWKKTRRLSMRQEHRAGEKLFIDFCGPTVPVINPDTGEMSTPRFLPQVTLEYCRYNICWDCF